MTATEVGGALVPKLIDELLRSELMCLNQVVRERFRLETHGQSSLSMKQPYIPYQAVRQHLWRL